MTTSHTLITLLMLVPCSGYSFVGATSGSDGLDGLGGGLIGRQQPAPNLIVQETYAGPSFLPPAPDAIGGGNPFQGLGRSDDPGPSREKQFGFPSFNDSGFNSNGIQNSPAPSTQTNSFPGGFIPTSVLDSPSANPTNSQSSLQGLPSGTNNSQQFAPGFGGQAGFGTTGSLSPDNSLPNTGAANGNSPAGSQGPFGFGGGNNNSSGNSNNGSGSGESGSGIGFGFGSSGSGSSGSGSSGSGSSGFGNGSGNSGITGSGNGGSGGGTRAGSGNWFEENRTKTSDSDDKSGTGGEKSTNLQEDLTSPVTPIRQSSGSLSSLNASNAQNSFDSKNHKTSVNPLSTTIEEIKLGKLPDALKSVNKVLQSDAQNPNAHYLKAVVSVLSRNFDEAKKEYQLTIKLSRNEELTNRAKIGLSKLIH